jgi:hypothetical protein
MAKLTWGKGAHTALARTKGQFFCDLLNVFVILSVFKTLGKLYFMPF